jgi:hypothetical protein
VQFLAGMARHAALFLRHHRLRLLAGQQDLWLRLEQFQHRLHASLDLDRVAYTLANEGCTLLGCDRLSVAERRGRKVRVAAVSGVDGIDPRSRQVRLLSRLCERVLAWGERLVYRGVPDDALPPAVARALDDYLAERGSQLLAVLPLRGETGPPRFALLVECFGPDVAVEPTLSRLEVLGRSASSALNNAAAYSRIPLRRFWESLARLQEGPLGPAGLRHALLVLVLAGLVAALACWPCPLKIDGTGQLLPRERRWLYAPVEGQVVRFEPGVRPGSLVSENQAVVLLYDVQLELKLLHLANDVARAREDVAALAVQQTTARTEAERVGLGAEKQQREFVRQRKLAELNALRERTGADESRPGYFWLRTPLGGTVLNSDFRERLTNRTVPPSEPLLRIGDKGGGWEVELKVPQKHLGPVLEAFAQGGGEELDVDLLLLSAPAKRFKGKLARAQLAGEAVCDGGEGEPVVRASVRLDGPGIAVADRVPADLLLTGTEVHAKVHCGRARALYALFYGVWEFLCEKVLFF